MPFYQIVVLFTLAMAGCKSKADELGKDTNDFFGTGLVRLKLELSPASVARLRSQPREYARGTLVHGEESVATKVKLKGHRSFRKFGDHPAFKLRFDHKDKRARFHGLRSLVLNNMADDPTRLRESLGYALYRAAGVPAPRTTLVQLAVGDGPTSLYLAVEPIDEEFLNTRFGKTDAGLFSGDYGCDVYVADVARMKHRGGPKSSRTKLAELAAELEGNSSGTLVDWERVVSFLAVSTFLGDFDGYWHSHNYYLHNSAPGGTWSLVPWGIDRVLIRRVDVFGSRGRLAELCFADKACRLRYGRRLLEVAVLADEIGLTGEATRLIALIDDAGIDSPRNEGAARKRQGKRQQLRNFLRLRGDEVRQALRCMDNGGDCSAESTKELRCEWQSLRAGVLTFEFCNQRLSWHEARAACDKRGLVLATINSATESEIVGVKAGALNRRRWWIGASDLESESEFVWQDGTGVSWSAWSKNQPDDKNCGQDCVALSSKGRWADRHCEQHLPFVCGRP